MRTIILAYFATAVAALAFAQSSIPVYLDPASDAPQIGSLESPGELVPAEWPAGIDAQQGWQPVYYQGGFEVYVANNDIGKDVAPKPGSLYYLEPRTDAPKLAIATDKDRTDIISVDTRFCKLRLETIVLGYVPTSAIQAGITAQVPVEPGEVSGGEETFGVKELQGVLEKTSLLTRNRTGLAHKLSTPQGQTLALIDLSGLPERVRVEDYLQQSVEVIGALKPGESGNSLILVAQSLKKTN